MQPLPQPPPSNPMPLIALWLRDAADAVAKNPWAMALATVADDSRPSVRYVLLKELDPKGFLVFYTNYGSRKAQEIDATGSASGALYWPELGRQLRFEGTVVRSPAAESDAYFSSRPRLSQLNAWASRQSAPIESPQMIRARIAEHEHRFAGQGSVPRPDHWGGYRLMIEAAELWIEGDDRFHERLRYERSDRASWSHRYLQP